MLKAIIFDFDGVIVDSEPLHYGAFVEVLAPFGFELDYQTYLADFVGFDDRDFFHEAIRRISKNGRAVEVVDLAELMRRKSAAFDRIVDRGIIPLPGIKELVDTASQRMPIAIASGALSGEIRKIAEGIGILDRFEAIVAADDVAVSKPDPETYRKAFEALQNSHRDLKLSPGDCLAIEDTPAGIASAKAAGLHVLGVTTTVDPQMLQAADRVVAGFNDLTLDTILRWFDS